VFQRRQDAGGPQAGIIAGAKALVDRLRAHPLMRALRADKLTLRDSRGDAGGIRRGPRGHDRARAAHAARERDEIEARARRWPNAWPQAAGRVALVSGSSAVGGGSAPGLGLPTVLLAIARDGHSAAATEQWLRTLDPPVVARIENDRVVLDLRTVLLEQDDSLATALSS
jgi:L-seryl-tRNA(Ser) seleniumtransferase